jgi:hypothetical protein
MKRTEQDTFNISFLDITSTGPQFPYKISQVETNNNNNNNKSWANSENKQQFADYKKNSNILDQYYNKLKMPIT